VFIVSLSKEIRNAAFEFQIEIKRERHNCCKEHQARTCWTDFSFGEKDNYERIVEGAARKIQQVGSPLHRLLLERIESRRHSGKKKKYQKKKKTSKWGKGEEAMEAFKLALRKARQGLAASQHFVGNAYYDGNGVEKNLKEAFKWSMKAAEQGHAQAQFMVGNAYYDGDGVEQNLKEAFKWYMKAAEQGHDEAQYNVGIAHLDDEGVDGSVGEAVKWFLKAKENGFSVAASRLVEIAKSLPEFSLCHHCGILFLVFLSVCYFMIICGVARLQARRGPKRSAAVVSSPATAAKSAKRLRGSRTRPTACPRRRLGSKAESRPRMHRQSHQH
jgi:tetratricopeptide (TPR) repeat protein